MVRCSNCGHSNELEARFCTKCGTKIATSSEVDEVGSVDKYFLKRDVACQECGSLAETKDIKLYKNIGMLVMRRNYSLEGRFCKKCINKNFWDYTLTTLFLGWWGTISFIVTPFYLMNNTVRYLTTLGMREG
jgi:hypothetical protein